MDKDLINFKNWSKHLGLETDGKIDDDVLKKLIPPQRRDMWRYIMSHVLPEKDVELIKKSILLHKLRERQKPLMARVETEEDLSNALKYEELIKKYNKIQKEIADAKENNNKLKTDLKEKIELKSNLVKNTELKRDSMYLIKHKKKYFSELTEILKENSDMCNHFSLKANENLTKTDYQDSLIKCLIDVDDAKQSGVMHDGVNIGNQLCNNLYTTIRDKSPKIYIQTIEENLKNHIDESNKMISEERKITESNFDINVFNELLVKLFRKQLELKSELSSALGLKVDGLKQLKDTTVQEKNEIISQYKLKNLSCTDQELLALEEKLNESFEVVIANSINNSNTIGSHDMVTVEKESFKTLDNILEKINILNDEINENKNIVSEMLKEFKDKRSDFGLTKAKSIIDQFAEYCLKNDKSEQINEKISCIKDYVSSVVSNLIKPIIPSTPESSILNFRTVQDIKHQSEMIDVFSKFSDKFEQLNKTLCEEKSIDDIIKSENMRKLEFNNTMQKVETNILDLDTTVEDCKLIVDVLSTIQLKDFCSPNVSTTSIEQVEKEDGI